VGENAIENWPPTNFDSTTPAPASAGAAGTSPSSPSWPGTNNQYLHWYADGSLPGLSGQPDDGDHLKSLLTAGPRRGVDEAARPVRPGTVYNVYGTVPGRHYGTSRTSFIVVHTPLRRGWRPTRRRRPRSCWRSPSTLRSCLGVRDKSLLFVTMASHFRQQGPRGRTTTTRAYVLAQQGKVKCAFVLEMIASKQDHHGETWRPDGRARA